MKKVPSLLLAALFIGTPILSSAAAATEPPLIERRIVIFSKGTPRDQRARIIELAGGFVVQDLWLIDAVSLVTHAIQAQSLDKELASRPEVLRVEKDAYQDFLLKAPPPSDQAPPTPSLPWNIKRVHAPQAWLVTRAEGVKVAILDTGVDLRHPALEIAGGHNSVDGSGASYMDDNGHGTHVAGTVAAQDVGRGVIGVAPGAELYAVKVLNQSGGTFTSIIAGLQWCVANRMDAANMSFGTKKGSQALAEAVRNAAAAGLTMVAAAGNTSDPVLFPAAYPEVIAVGASDKKDVVPDWTARGPQVAFIAPGVDIRSTKLNGNYEFKEGTSMSAPHVTGLVCLLMAARGAHGGEAVRAALKEAATPLPEAPPQRQGAGMVEGDKLVETAPVKRDMIERGFYAR
jgi:subtilisin family serine protease